MDQLGCKVEQLLRELFNTNHTLNDAKPLINHVVRIIVHQNTAVIAKCHNYFQFSITIFCSVNIPV